MASMNSITTILQFGHNKHCFLNLVESYQRQHDVRPSSKSNSDGGVVVYEADLARGQKGYFSVHGKSVELMSGDKVQLNGLYANKLGLKDGEPLPLRQIRAVVPTARRVQVEPISPDDWEILEQNAGRVETVLLDQVRVVWPGQLLPVWIQRSVCIFMKIVSAEPVSSSCVVLESNSEIVVAPKVRASHPPTSLSLPSQQPLHRQPQPQNKQQQQLQTSKAAQSSKIVSPCQARARDVMSTSDYDNADTLEPKPHNRSSPGRSPRLGHRKMQPSKHSNFQNSVDVPSLQEKEFRPMVRRQSSIMDSIMKYFFPFRSEKEDYDSHSDSDAGSAIDYTMKELPSRNGVLRVQPMRLSCTIEECVSKVEVSNLFASKPMWSFRNSGSSRHTFDSHADEAKRRCNVPYEVFHTSTVYVDAECTKNERLLHPYLPILPNSFIARLQKIPSPQEKAAASQKSGKKAKGDGKDDAGAGMPLGDIETPMGPNPALESGGGPDGSIFKGSCYVRVVAIDRKAGLTDDAWQEAADRVLTEQPLLHNHIIIPDMLRRQLKLEATSSVWLHTGSIDLVIPRKVCIYPLTTLPKKVTNDMLVSAFRKHIKQCADTEHPMVLFQGIFLKYKLFPEAHVEVQLTFFGENDLSNAKAVTLLSEANIESVLVTVERNLKEDKMGVVNSMLSYCQIMDFDPQPLTVKLKHLGGLDNIAQQALNHLMACLGARPLSRNTFQARAGLAHGVLLITGPKGCGKTSLVKGLCRKMSHLPVLAHIALIDCKSLRGKSVSHIQRIMEAVFDEAAWREPAVIVFDNLDVIVPAPSGPETEINGEALYSAKNVQVFQGLLNYEIENNSRVTVIATSTSRNSLHPHLVSSRGKHFIQQTLNIGSPDKEVREKILESLLQNHTSVKSETAKTLNLMPLAVKTEGFVARDLEGLVNRAIHNKLTTDREAFKDKINLTHEDFETALCNFKPVSIRNVPLHKAGELGWDDVGGLTSVKTSLEETLRWPTKYPQLFSSCPLRLRSGILLYGAPGTGKTLLAGVVAKECGLNFISIKGPELLSKYIGASEQAVRDLFTRAQSAKPCILFFDEFDSIAPKRGHDSTGVTDRVVNQLLTQLDGVEGLQGVYVLGATSRPDLIDPALLRPGRLDKCLNCAMPDENERAAILRSLTRKMSLACDVDLEELAEICEHFTGADLKALLYNAQLKAIHEQAGQDRNANDSVVRIKGDDAECSAVRRASQILDETVLSQLSLPTSRSVSPGSTDDNSPRSPKKPLDSARSRSQSLSPKELEFGLDSSRSNSTSTSQSHAGSKSPVESVSSTPGKKNASGNNAQKVIARKVESKVVLDGEEEGDDQVDSPQTAKWIGDEEILRQGNFPFPDHDEIVPKSAPTLQTGKTRSDSDFDDQLVEKLDLRFIDDGNSSPSPTSGRSIKSIDPLEGEKPSKMTSQDSESSQLERDIINSIKAFGDAHADSLNLQNIPVANRFEDMRTKPSAPSKFESVTDSQSEHENDLKEVVAIKILKSSTSDAEDGLDPASTYPPTATSKRRRRGYERAQSEVADEQKLMAVTKSADADSKSPSVEKKPVTVFTSLERGLATLSAEDEARYLAMVKEIQRRDETLFEAANARRRTSLQLASRPSVLLQVCQRHLLEATKSMRPSVSPSERQKYMRIYENFVSSRTGDFDKSQESQMGKRATLA